MLQPGRSLILLFLCFFCVNSLSAQPSSVLSQGTWYKLSVTQSGVYQISGKFLQDQGVNIADIDLKKIGIFGYGGGMLPQSLSEPRLLDLPENSIHILGTEDGSLDPEDQIVFFAEGPDKEGFLPAENGIYRLSYEKNLYADTAFYFLTLSEGKDARVKTKPSVNISGEPISTFDDFWVHEKDLFNILEPGSGREWYGENFYSGDILDLVPEIAGIASDGDFQLQVDVLGRTTSSSSLEVSFNQQLLGEIPLEPILGGTYTDKGKEANANFYLPAEQVAGGAAFQLKLRYQATDGRGRAHLNRVLLQYPRQLRLFDSQTMFRSLESTQKTVSSFYIATNKENLIVWDITDPQQPMQIVASFEEEGWTFGTETIGQLREFIVFEPSALPSPVWEGIEESHNLPLAEVPDLLIVTPPSLRSAAERLANLRRSHDQLSVQVTTTEAIYRQYASGRQDVSAIRNYTKDLYDAAPGKLKYLLLMGKASYDYKNRLDDNINLVPTYQSRNSLHPIYSYPSDDYFGFLEDDEGYWEESFNGDHNLDIGVGRLPVKNLQEANQVVDKLIHYATSSQSLGDWRTNVTFLADDGDNDRYQKDSELLSTSVDANIQGFNSRKIYLDAYEQEKFPNQELAPAVNEAIEEAIEKGSLLFNYVGHGNEQRLADENVLNVGMISRWQNLDRMPFFVTATCEFGRHDDPERISGAERLVLNPAGGAVGMVTTARPVFSNTNYLLNQAFYRYVFAQEEGEFLRIGDIFRKTKNDALNGRDNRNFSLLGDPSMRLAYPRHRIMIDSLLSVNEQQLVDTIRAFQTLRVFGRIIDESSSERIDNFHGELTLVLHDKAVSLQTRGNEGTVMQFRESNNVINRVKASVKNGMFSVDLLVPQNINYQTDLGRLHFYALSDQPQVADAFGGMDSLLIGGSLSEVLVDRVAPEIRLFINDTTFLNGSISGEDPVLIARFQDDQGINLSRQQLGHEIRATLHKHGESQILREFVLNDFYDTDLNDFTRGSLQYPLGNLEEGKYVLTLQAWDTHNNRAQSSVEFLVSDKEKLHIQNFINYPNPFNQSTTFVLEHNRAGEDLSVNLRVFDAYGDEILEFEREYLNAASRLELLNWQVENDLTGALSAGVYLVKVRLMSQTDRQEVDLNLRILLSN